MRRRDFIKVIAGSAAAAWPLATRAQQPPVAVIGFLRQIRAEESGHVAAAVREGLSESGYSSDKVIIESRWGDGREEQLPKLARELVALPVAAIVAGSIPPARAAKAVTTNIPIIFVTGLDPQTEGLVSSISRPGGGPFFNVRRNQLIGLAALHALPAGHFLGDFVGAGGLVSYGASQTDAYRRAGVYVARILKGEKPGDLPVELPTKFDLAINLRTAKTLGLSVPPELIARANEVIQ